MDRGGGGRQDGHNRQQSLDILPGPRCGTRVPDQAFADNSILVPVQPAVRQGLEVRARLG
jgi:hypothetical protein